jgi:hypothetical protein
MGEMNQTTIEKMPLADKAKAAAATSLADVTAAFDLAAMQALWQRNLVASAEAVRTLQQQNADFAGQLIELQMQAARCFTTAEPLENRFSKPFELGASALQLYIGYLGQSAALAQKALPWAAPKHPA